jgi:hypothetical protein
VSERPRDEDELQALLSGESALSRRYRELSDEQPPAKIDAAILASSRWAVGADSHGASSRRTGSNQTGSNQTGSDQTGSNQTSSDETGSQQSASHRTGSHTTGPDSTVVHRIGSTWRRSSFMRWSVPLATAAVVVVTATLTLTIDRDPEIERIYDKFDKPSADARESSSEMTDGKTEVAASKVPAPASAPEPPSAPVPPRAPASASSPAPVVAAPQTAQLKEQRENAARKRSVQPQQELAATRSVERDSPGRVAEDIGAGVVGEQKVIAEENVSAAERPAEAFPGSDDTLARNRPGEVGGASADVSRDELAVAGASVSSDPADTIEAEELMKSAAESPPDRQQPSAQLSDSESIVAQERADQDSPAQFAEAEAEAMRDPEEWIESIDNLLADGKRDEAIASIGKFRLEYPDYQLPEDLQSLLPPQTE